MNKYKEEEKLLNDKLKLNHKEFLKIKEKEVV